MKTVIYMAISLNGLIAKKNGSTSWTSKEDSKLFIKNLTKARNIVIGRNTFDVCMKDGSFPFKGALNVVMTKENIQNKWGDNVVITSEPPAEILKFLENRGFETAFVAGGGMINSSFLKEGLVDELYTTLEPIIFGKGVPLFGPEDFEFDLELLESKKLNENTIQFHYKIKK